MNRPNAAQLAAFYKANREYVDLIVESALKNDPQRKAMLEQMEFERQLKEFAAEFPTVEMHTPEDFVKQENASEFIDLIQKGLSLAQAYKLCNYRDLMEKENQKGKKVGMERAGSKAHLRPTGVQAASTSGSVPEEVKAIYHALLGDWSESDIAKHYHKK